MSPRALVTGATGFIGSHLVDLLLARGWQVRCLVRSRERARTLAALPVELELGDLGDAAALARAAAGVECVFHVAGLTRALREVDYHAVNAEGTARLLKISAQQNDSLQRFLLVSSLAAAGPTIGGAPLTEDSPCRPVSPYGRSKLNAELVAQGWMAHVPCTIIRPPIVYGPRDTDVLTFFRLVALGLQPTLGRPRHLSLVYVSDLVEGMLLAATSPHAAGRTYFITGGDTSLDEALQLIGACLGRRPRRVRVPLSLLDAAAWASEGAARALRAPTVLTRNKVQELRQPAWLCSAARAKRELGFEPRVALADGLAQTARWYRTAGWL
ncbi:MAG: NAD-dependent epimerase/dehydratase family protein [Chloroflexi bacterium]|nr:NAD-dependent epimerase/dehydratase family protein [Chloroflexota bacterium]